MEIGYTFSIFLLLGLLRYPFIHEKGGDHMTIKNKIRKFFEDFQSFGSLQHLILLHIQNFPLHIYNNFHSYVHTISLFFIK